MKLAVDDFVLLPSGEYGQVVSINAWSSEFPADLQILVPSAGAFVKLRADEVVRVPRITEDRDFS